PFSGAEGLSAGEDLTGEPEDSDAWCRQHGQLVPSFTGAVAWPCVGAVVLAGWMANMQHQPCGKARSRVPAKARDRITGLLMPALYPRATGWPRPNLPASAPAAGSPAAHKGLA